MGETAGFPISLLRLPFHGTCTNTTRTLRFPLACPPLGVVCVDYTNTTVDIECHNNTFSSCNSLPRFKSGSAGKSLQFTAKSNLAINQLHSIVSILAILSGQFCFSQVFIQCATDSMTCAAPQNCHKASLLGMFLSSNGVLPHCGTTAKEVSPFGALPVRTKSIWSFGQSTLGLYGIWRCWPFPILASRFGMRNVSRRSIAPPESDGTLGVPERYSSEDWSEHIRNFPFSIILKRIKSHLAFNAVFALCIHILNSFTGFVRPPPLALLSACSTALGLLLVFRTTAAYERWCAGYRCVRETKQHLQQLRRLARLWMSEEDLEWMDVQLATFPAYLGTFLGGGVGARGKSWALLGEMERDPRDILVTFGEGVYKCLGPESPQQALYVQDGTCLVHWKSCR